MEKFYKFRGPVVVNTFGINRLQKCDTLNYWLEARYELDDFDLKTLDKAIERYNNMAASWNEEELKMHFISAIFTTADPNINGVCKTYFERPIEGIVQNYAIHVVTDCMIAQPKLGGDPDKPYFFLQEFKQSQQYGRTDPEGQMLVAMLLAQEKNADDKTLYGCYVIERNWFFTTLNGLDYCVSQQYNATNKSDLLQIVYTLRKLKELIVAR